MHRSFVDYENAFYARALSLSGHYVVIPVMLIALLGN